MQLFGIVRDVGVFQGVYSPHASLYLPNYTATDTMPTRPAEDEPAGHLPKRVKADSAAAPAIDEGTAEEPIFADVKTLLDTDLQKQLHAQFKGIKSSAKSAAGTLARANITIAQKPFPSVQLQNVLNSKLAKAAQEQLIASVSYAPKGNDLYSYRGSGDLADDTVCPPGSPLARLRDGLYSEDFTNFISSVTGVRLFANRPDLSSHQYHNGDHLLAHDDDVQGELDVESEGRRIAFILYLVDEKWDQKDGGSLDLFKW